MMPVTMAIFKIQINHYSVMFVGKPLIILEEKGQTGLQAAMKGVIISWV